LDPLLSHLDFWEIALYVMALAFLFESTSIDAVERDSLQLMIYRHTQCLFLRTLEIFVFTNDVGHQNSSLRDMASLRVLACGSHHHGRVAAHGLHSESFWSSVIWGEPGPTSSS
jgi:hypothetical protein